MEAQCTAGVGNQVAADATAATFPLSASQTFANIALFENVQEKTARHAAQQDQAGPERGVQRVRVFRGAGHCSHPMLFTFLQ
jgi:hypothetical protein